MCKVSVIIPVYNVEKYLEATLDSVINQTLRDIEIICVNDGSTDKSMDIIKEFEAKDSRIKIINQKNKGLSGARNAGLNKASGEYVAFLDSDDYLAQNALERLYEEAKQYRLDALLFDADTFFDTKDLADKYKSYLGYYTRNKVYDSVYTGQQLFFSLVKNDDYRSSACLQIIRREMMVEHNISFEEGIIYEDNIFSFLILMNAQRMKHISDKLYFRRIRKDSIMTKNITASNFVSYYICVYRFIEILLEQIEKKPLQSGVMAAAQIQISTFFNRMKDIHQYNLTEDERKTILLDMRVKGKDFGALLGNVNGIEYAATLGREYMSLLNQIGLIENSKEYKVGRIVLFLPKRIKRMILRARGLV